MRTILTTLHLWVLALLIALVFLLVGGLLSEANLAKIKNRYNRLPRSQTQAVPLLWEIPPSHYSFPPTTMLARNKHD